MEDVENEAEPAKEINFLKKVLDEEEYGALSETIIKKIETSIQESFDDFLTRKALYESSKLDHETQVAKLQEEYNEKIIAFDELNVRLENANSEIRDLQDKLQNALEDVTKIQETNKKLQYEWQDFKTQRDLAVEERESLLQMIERRNTENLNMKTDLQDLNKQLQSAVKAKMVALENAEEVESLKISLSYKEKRLEQESSLMKNQVESLTSEVQRLTSEIMNLKRANMSRALAAEADIAEKTQELTIAQETIADLKDTNSQLSEKVESLLEKLVDQRNSSDEMFDKFQQELQAQKKLSQLYKGLCDENDTKTEKLTNAISELQQLLKEATDQYGTLETTFKEAQLKYEDEICQRNESIILLKKELQDANELLKATKEENLEATMATLSPCAAAASRLIKSGMTLTQIYTQYASVSEQLLLEKEENRKLQLYVSTILNEIEEKAPILRQQRIDYEKAVNNVESLTKQMDEMISEAKVLSHESSEAKKMSNHLGRENERLKKELGDLGRQVCYLIKAVEEARGNVISDLDGSQISYDGDGSSAQHVISRKLVTFGSIQDLQENNQKLLALVRQLSAKQEAAEGISSAEYHDLKVKEEELQKRLGELMDDMERQSKMLDLIRNQSLTYKKLYEQAVGGQGSESNRSTPTKGSPSIITSTPKISGFDEPSRAEEVNKRLEATEQKIKKLEEEKSYLKADALKKEKDLNEQIQKMRSELNEFIYKNSKLAAQAEYHEEKNKVLETNIKTLKKQIQALEERNGMLSEISAKYEQSVVHLKDEVMSIQGKLAKAEVTLENLKQENFLLKTTEARLVKEREAWERERHSHSMLMSNLDAIKATFERSEAEGKLRLEMQLTDALKECTALRNSLKDEKDRFRELASSLERKTNTAKERMLEEKQLADKAREELDSVKEELTAKCNQITELNAKIRDLTNQPVKSVIDSVTVNLDESTKKIKELERKVDELEREALSLQNQLTATKQHSAQYCEMAETLEKQLHEALEEHEMFRKLMTEKLDDAVEKKNDLMRQYEELQQKYKDNVLKQTSSAEELAVHIESTNTELRSTSTELTRLKQVHDNTLEELENAKLEVNTLQKALQEAEAKYSNEVVLHSSDIQALASIKKELWDLTGELGKLKLERDEALEALKAKASQWEEQEKKSREELEDANERLTELDDQNKLLHDKLQELGSQLAILQARVVDEGQTPLEDSIALNDSFEMSNKSQDQLLKVIKFIRQEKDVAVTRGEVLQAENTRIKSQLLMLQKQLEEAEESLKKKKESAEVSMSTSAKHAELLRKIDTLNAVTDSNRILREERDKFKTEATLLRESLKSAEAKLEPLVEEQKKLTEKIDALTTENQASLMDAARWKQKANQLAERSNKATPEDWRRLTNERENLAKQWQLEKNNNTKLEEELKKAREEKTTMNERIAQMLRALQNDSNEIKRVTEECNNFKAQYAKVNEELLSAKTQLSQVNEAMAKLTNEVAAKEVILTELRQKENQLKRIAKRYKTQCEELTKTIEEDKRSREAKEAEEKKKAEEEAAKPIAIPDEEREKLKEEGRNEVRNEMTPKLTEVETVYGEKIKEFEHRLNLAQEEAKNLRQDNENLKTSINEKEERAKQLMKNARSKIVSLTEEKNGLEEELKKLKDQSEQEKDESDSKLETLKAQYNELMALMDKERSSEPHGSQDRDRFLSQMKNISEKMGEGSDKSPMEPPTANIKPITGSSSAAARKQKQTTGKVGPCWRSSGNETPFASIRPISMQTRTLAVLPTSQTSHSQGSSSQATPVMVLPQQQIVHTTGNTGEALSSSPTSSHTDYMPATSSATPIRQVVVAPPLSVGPPMGSDAQSTQPQSAQQPQQAQAMAMVLPRERVEQQTTTTTQSNQQQSIDQSCGVAYSQANSSNTVTTTQAGLKRPRDVEGDSSTGLEGEEMAKVIPQNKRTRILVSGNQAEVFHHQITHSEGIEVEYQVPTSSQRDQEDDIIMVDSEEEGNADDGDVEPDDEPEFEEEDNGEGYEIGSYSRDGQEINMVNYDEGPDIDEENVPDQDNNEVEVIDDSNEVPNQSGSSRDGVADNGNATQSSSNAAVPVASSIESVGQDQTFQQSSEATSSGPVTIEDGSNIVVVSHAASSQPSQIFRTRNVPPLSRQQQSQLLLPQSYEESGDDSIVPSTPTLFIPRRADGFGEAVSSPQVPLQARFTFSDPSPPITRSGVPPASGEGSEDGSQLEEAGTGRSVPTTPLQVSPQEIPVVELIGEVGQSSSGTQRDAGSNIINIPNITVTAVEDDGNSEMPPPELSDFAGEDEEANEKEDTSGEEPEIINLDEDNDGVTSEGEKPPSAVGEIEEGREAEPSEPFESGNLRRPMGRGTGTARRSGKNAFLRRSTARRPTPIVWHEPGSSSSSPPVGSAIPTVLRSHVPPVRVMSSEPQRMVVRGRITRTRHRTWR